MSWCKQCQGAARVKKWESERREYVNAKRRARIAALAALGIRRIDTWKKRNPAASLAITKRWQAKNPEKTRAAWTARNERVKAERRPILEAKRAESLANRSRQAISTARSKARKLGLPIPPLPAKELVRYHGNCVTCSVEVVRVKSDGRTDRCNACRNNALSRLDHARRRSREARASPAWTDHGAIAAIYQMASRASLCTGIQFHVDHVLPIRGKTVSGMHVPENLRMLPKIANLRKGNRFDGESA